MFPVVTDAYNHSDNTPQARLMDRSQNSWSHNLVSPLGIAALVTWAAILLQVLGFEQIPFESPRQWLGLALLGGFAVLLVAWMWRGKESTGDYFLAAQIATVLLATWCLRSGALGVLLVVVTVQLTAEYSLRATALCMFVADFLLAWIWSIGLPWPRFLWGILPLVGFQVFAALVGHYAAKLERAHRELGRVNMELLSTQKLLAESARSEERLRLSRELHDVAGHKLTALKLNLAAMTRGKERDEDLTLIKALTDELLADIRQVVGEMRRHEGVELAGALQAMAAALPGVELELQVDENVRVPDLPRAEALLRCAQEAVTNAIRHGGARQITVRCQRQGTDHILQVSDHGALSPQLIWGNGLLGMRERLQHLGGRLQVEATPPRGVTLTATLPCADAGAAHG